MIYMEETVLSTVEDKAVAWVQMAYTRLLNKRNLKRWIRGRYNIDTDIGFQLSKRLIYSLYELVCRTQALVVEYKRRDIEEMIEQMYEKEEEVDKGREESGDKRMLVLLKVEGGLDDELLGAMMWEHDRVMREMVFVKVRNVKHIQVKCNIR